MTPTDDTPTSSPPSVVGAAHAVLMATTASFFADIVVDEVDVRVEELPASRFFDLMFDDDDAT